MRKAEAVQPRAGEHERVIFAREHLLNARIDVAAHGQNVRLRKQLLYGGSAAGRARADAQDFPPRKSEERVARVGARQAEKCIVRLVRGQILGGVHGDVQFARCNHLRKDIGERAAPDFRERRGEVGIAARADDDQLALHAPFQIRVLHKARLRHGERRAARSDLQLPHDSSNRARNSRSYAS